eukprot:scaffold8159_cov64-Phaeocystis_antarctica.AAC.2
MSPRVVRSPVDWPLYAPYQRPHRGCGTGWRVRSAPRSSSVDRVTLAPDSGSATPLALSVQLQLKATCPFSVPLHETSCALACSSNSSPAPSMSVAVGAAIVTTGAGVVSRVTVRGISGFGRGPLLGSERPTTQECSSAKSLESPESAPQELRAVAPPRQLPACGVAVEELGAKLKRLGGLRGEVCRDRAEIRGAPRRAPQVPYGFARAGDVISGGVRAGEAEAAAWAEGQRGGARDAGQRSQACLDDRGRACVVARCVRRQSQRFRRAAAHPRRRGTAPRPA